MQDVSENNTDHGQDEQEQKQRQYKENFQDIKYKLVSYSFS